MLLCIVGGVLLLCREAIVVFYSPSQLGHRTLVWGVLLLCSDAIYVFYSPSRLGQRKWCYRQFISIQLSTWFPIIVILLDSNRFSHVSLSRTAGSILQVVSVITANSKPVPLMIYLSLKKRLKVTLAKIRWKGRFLLTIRCSLVSYHGHSLPEGVLTLCKDAILYSIAPADRCWRCRKAYEKNAIVAKS